MSTTGSGRCLLAAACVLAAGCTTTAVGTYWWSPTVEVSSGASVLDVWSDLGIEFNNSFPYEIVGEEEGQRLRVGYWQVKGSGDMAPAPRAYTFDTLAVAVGDVTHATVDLTVAELLYEPALVRAPNFRVRLVVGVDLVQFYMRVDKTAPAPAESAEVKIPADGTQMIDIGIGYQPVFLLGGGIEFALKPWLKVVGRVQLFDDTMFDLSSDFDGSFLGWEVGLVIGAPEGHGPAAVFGYRKFNAAYRAGTEDLEIHVGGWTASVLFAF